MDNKLVVDKIYSLAKIFQSLMLFEQVYQETNKSSLIPLQWLQLTMLASLVLKV